MELEKLSCRNCGETLEKKSDGTYFCKHCGSTFTDVTLNKALEQVKQTLGEVVTQALLQQKEEQIANIRRSLYKETHDKQQFKQYLNDANILSYCRKIKELVPDDFQANLYEAVFGDDFARLQDFALSVTELQDDYYVDETIGLLIKLLKTDTLLLVNDLIANAYEKKNLQKYNYWQQQLQPEAQKVDEGVYDVTLTRDVFVAYKSQDMKQVLGLVDYLERVEKLKCFVAARNLQHGKTSVYDDKLQQAVDNCKSFVFVSSTLSRKTGDAKNKELPYVKECDFKRGPAEYKARNDYKKLPHSYKKPRAEFVIEEYGNSATEEQVAEFFDGYERLYTYKDVAQSLLQQLNAAATVVAPEIRRKEYDSVSYAKKKTIPQGVTKRELAQFDASSVKVPDNIKINLAAEFLARKVFDSAIDLCNSILAENPSDGDAYWTLFLAEHKSVNIDELVDYPMKIRYDNFEKALAATRDKAKRKLYYDVLERRVKKFCRREDYKEFIELPDSSAQSIAALSNVMYQAALKNNDDALFDLVVKTVTDTDEYIAKNLEFARKKTDLRAALPYYKNVLQADEGNHEAMWQAFAAGLNSASDVFDYPLQSDGSRGGSSLEEKLFAYGFNEYAASRLAAICMDTVSSHTDKSAALFDFVLTMIPQRRNDLYKTYLQQYVKALFDVKKVSYADKYNNLLLALDKTNHEVYFTRCLIKRNLSNPLGLLKDYQNLLSDADYASAMSAYEKQFPSKKNLYTEIYFAFDSLKQLAIYPQCLDYVAEHLYVPCCELPNCYRKVMDFVSNAGRGLYNNLLAKYRCKNVGGLYNLRVDVSQDPDWQAALQFAEISGDMELQSIVNEILQIQPEKCRQNLAADQARKKRAKYSRKIQIVYIIVALFCIAVFCLTLGLSMSKISPMFEFWAGALGYSSMTGTAIAMIVLGCIAAVVAVATLVTRRGRAAVVSVSVMLACALVTVIVGGAGYNKAVDQKSSTYVGDGYVMELSAHRVSSTDNVTYVTDEYTIDKIYGSPKQLDLPDTYNGKPIVHVGGNAFSDCDEITEITLPRYVRSASYNAFAGCGKLETIRITAEKIPNNAFKSVVNVKNIVLEDTVKSVEIQAFADCPDLQSLTIGNGVTSIGYFAFYNCKNLKKLTIGEKVKQIEGDAFGACKSLETVYWNAAELTPVFKNCPTIKTVIIGNSVKSIADEAFKSCTGLTSVTIGDSVTEIGEYAFYNCSSITSVTIPNKVTTIGWAAFSNCSSLASVTIPSSVTRIRQEVFYNCVSLTTIKFNGTVSQWNSITKEWAWNYNVPATKVVCSDAQLLF